MEKVIIIIRVAASLSKIRISLSVTATTFTGFFVCAGSLSPELIPLLGGIFLLAAGSSACNHFQERKTDALMERTRRRPIPSGAVKPGHVVLISLAWLITGSILLLTSFPFPVILLGLFNFFLYNAVYTPLKKVTAFAVIPGALIGGFPPIIGWVAAGGHWMDAGIMVIVIFFFIGQIPHFWLLLLRYGREYEMAGMPSLTALLSPVQINRITYAWIIATIAASALLPAYGLITGPFLLILYSGGIIMLLISAAYQNFSQFPESRYRVPFVFLNFFYLLIMVLLTVNAANI